MTLQILCVEFVVCLAFPDIAHDAAAVAATVDVQDKDRQRGEPRCGRNRSMSFMQR
jgi:hypothetical protein